jgi:hypothetical protein
MHLRRGPWFHPEVAMQPGAAVTPLCRRDGHPDILQAAHAAPTGVPEGEGDRGVVQFLGPDREFLKLLVATLRVGAVRLLRHVAVLLPTSMGNPYR